MDVRTYKRVQAIIAELDNLFDEFETEVNTSFDRRRRGWYEAAMQAVSDAKVKLRDDFPEFE